MMKNNRTVLLAATTVAILALVVIAGIIASQPMPKPAPAKQPAPTSLSRTELDSRLIAEQADITNALLAAHPAIASLYTINPGKLYDQGQWYGTTLIYHGTDSDNRDTLRVLLLKKDGVWRVHVSPRQLLSTVESPDVPKSIMQDINRPALLPGTATSPAIQ